jgi:UDP-N-acetylmuramate--alanine ligase
VVKKWNLPLEVKTAKQITYGIEAPTADYYGTNLRVEGGRFYFDLTGKGQTWTNIELGLPGIHNCENAVAVCAMCLELGLSKKEIFDGLRTFLGVRRRFEYHLRSGMLVHIDDYAHHPTEIAALIDSVRLLYPGWHITGIFQPHLFSRTRDFMEGFAAELSRLDEVILMPIYPAREEPLPGITSDALLEKITADKKLMSSEQVLEWSRSRRNGVVLTIGAGDIDRIVSQVAVQLTAHLK